MARRMIYVGQTEQARHWVDRLAWKIPNPVKGFPVGDVYIHVWRRRYAHQRRWYGTVLHVATLLDVIEKGTRLSEDEVDDYLRGVDRMAELEVGDDPGY